MKVIAEKLDDAILTHEISMHVQSNEHFIFTNLVYVTILI